MLVAVGTRPEAIKIAPLLPALAAVGLEPVVVATAQHRHLLDQVFDTFGITPTFDLDVLRPGQTPDQVASRILDRLPSVLDEVRPAAVVVQGDTTTAFASALAGFHAGIPVVHLEAGLRTGNITAPFPEEMNRRLVTQLASLHLAPTQSAARNLAREGVPSEAVVVTGNTVIDALHLVLGRMAAPPEVVRDLDDATRVVVVTAHRRESWGAPMAEVATAIAQLARDHPDVVVVFPVHPNPIVRDAVEPVLTGIANVRLIEPLEYAAFARLLARSHLLLTDSGGLQEEGPSLGKPVLVLRDATERPEGVAAGTARLVGTHAATIVAAARELLTDQDAYARMAHAVNPYGDGRAAERSAASIRHLLGLGRRPDDFTP